MQPEGLIDMHNNNTMVALAYIKDNNNPYEAFCNFISFCLYQQKNKTLSHDKLCKKILDEFGLDMPFHMYNTCLHIMKKKEDLEIINGSYKLVKMDFNVKQFEITRRQLKQNETQILTNIINYAYDNYEQKWSEKEAKKYLNDFLMTDNNASTIFMMDDIQSTDYETMSSIWIVQQYVKSLIEVKDSNYNYLLEIVNGLMVYIGIYYSNDATKEISLQDTNFYFDTKLILRYLGYSTGVYVDAAKQLANMIREKYCGNICVFRHTIGEVSSALYKASIQLKLQSHIEDNELMNYYLLNQPDPDDLRIYSESVEYELQQNNIIIEEPINWNDNLVWLNNIDILKLETLIKKNRPNWNDKAIENDVATMNQINILRKGNYTEYFGGNKKLPIFVTTNYVLIKCIKSYICETINKEKDTSFNRNILPCISDNSLMCKLWLQLDSKDNSIAEMNLALNAHAILPYDNIYFNKLKEISCKLKDKYKFKIFNLDMERQIKLEDNITKTKRNNITDLDEDDLILYIDEIHKLETVKLSEQKDYYFEQSKMKDMKLLEKDNEVVKAYSRNYVNKLGFNRVYIMVANNWSIFLALILIFITSCLNLLANKDFVNVPTIISFVIVIFLTLQPYVIKVIEKKFSQKKYEDFIKMKLLSIAKNNYISQIEKKLSKDEYKYKSQIIQYCLSNTPCFNENALFDSSVIN